MQWPTYLTGFLFFSYFENNANFFHIFLDTTHEKCVLCRNFIWILVVDSGFGLIREQIPP